MQEVEPNVYTDYKFFTNTFFYDNLLAVIANDIVTHASTP